jgi:uncharacterized protein YukE
MPNWNPNWNNVIWDYGDANGAANELRRGANLLDETAARRKRAADVAQQEWRGRKREQFDRDLGEMLRRARELADQMRSRAQAIDDASQRVREEQRHRQRERERWYEEKKEEDRIERERRESEQNNFQ